jgi:hypothetical protein
MQIIHGYLRRIVMFPTSRRAGPASRHGGGR